MRNAYYTLLVLVIYPAICAEMQQSKTIEVPANGQWLDSGIVLQPGDIATAKASGSVKYSDSQKEAGPEGLSKAWMDLLRILPFSDAGRGALIGRVSDSPAARPFLIGESRQARASISGKLYLMVNQASTDNASGGYKVRIEVTRPKTEGNSYTGVLPNVTPEMINSIPRRVSDETGAPGDRTNFVIIGSEQQLRHAFELAGWVTVDRTVKDSILRGVLATLSKQAYVTLPMSTLYLWERPQDFGYAQADPLMVVAARHHFRLWRAPFTADGSTVWVGAGTHDIGFDRDQRNDSITHKIDSDTDKERDYIGESLRTSGLLMKSQYFMPTDPIKKAKTAHGQEFYSDGRTLALWLKPDGGEANSSFSDTFCSVLARNSPEGGNWGECSKWLVTPGKSKLSLDSIPGASKYRVLIVPGIMNTCVADKPAFVEAHQVLKDKYGIQVDVLNVPNDSSEDNAKLIAGWMAEQQGWGDQKFIVVGYSKGTPDLQVMLATVPESRNRVAAFVSVAGASGGSPIADSIPEMAAPYMGHAGRAGCKGNTAAGMASLRQNERRAFLSRYPNPFVPTWSIYAVVDPARVPTAAAGTYKVMAAYDPENDGQLTKKDAIIPGSTILGGVKSDHLSVALPFESGSFPRAALLESILRVVIGSLEGKK